MIIIGEKPDATSQQDLQDDLPPPAYDDIHLSSRPRYQNPSSLNPRLSVSNPSRTSDAASSSKPPYMTPSRSSLSPDSASTPSRSFLSPDSASTSLQHSQSQITVSSPRSGRHVASSSYHELPTSSASSSYPAPARPSSTSAQPNGQYAPGQSPLTVRRLIMPGESITALLDPPPLSFQRSPAPNLPYSPFEACALMGVSGNLSLAFPLLAPPSSAVPHPFVTHDVNERDWTCFVRDVKAAASLAPTKSLLADVAAPVTARLPLMGFLVAKGLEMHWKNKRSGPAGELVDYWNHHFFHPRRLHVVLARGVVSFSGADMPPPDRAGSSSPELSITTSAFKDGSPPYDLEERKRTKKAAEKERKKQKKQRKSELSDASEENWRLVVAYYPH